MGSVLFFFFLLFYMFMFIWKGIVKNMFLKTDVILILFNFSKKKEEKKKNDLTKMAPAWRHVSSGFCLSTLLRMTHVRSPYHQLAYDNNKQPWNKRYAPTGYVNRNRKYEPRQLQTVGETSRQVTQESRRSWHKGFSSFCVKPKGELELRSTPSLAPSS